MHDEDESDIIVYDVPANKLAQVVYVVPLHIELVVLGEHVFDAPVMMALCGTTACAHSSFFNTLFDESATNCSIKSLSASDNMASS